MALILRDSATGSAIYPSSTSTKSTSTSPTSSSLSGSSGSTSGSTSSGNFTYNGTTYAPSNGLTAQQVAAQYNPELKSGSTAAPTTTSTAAPGGFTSFVQVPGDKTVYGITSTGQHVGFESWDQLLAANSGQAPKITPISNTPTNSVNYSQYAQSTQAFQPTGDPKYDALLKQMQGYLDQLNKNGQMINPNVKITPDQLAAFTSQAVKQIHPYFATQLQAATDSYLSNLGYDVNQLKNQVAQAETTYGRNLDTLASNSADQGFAQSGIRVKQEQQLATDTQNGLDQARSSLMNNAANSARTFGQQFGGTNIPTAPTLGAAPRVLPGVSKFDTTGANTGLYQLDPNIYNKLIGTEQNSEKQATDTLSSQLASNAQQLASNSTTRSLNLTQ